MQFATIKNKLKQIKINRWYVELILLGIILIPIWILILWIQQRDGINSDSELVKRALIGICAGILGLAIWVLGASVIVINILSAEKSRSRAGVFSRFYSVSMAVVHWSIHISRGTR